MDLIQQDPLSMEFPSQEYWSQLLFSSPGIFPTQKLNPLPPACISINYISQVKIWSICVTPESPHIILSTIYPQSSTPETIILISIATD